MSRPQNIWNIVSGLRKEGRVEDALNVLRDAIRRGELDPEGTDRAGRLIGKTIASGEAATKPTRVLILGQCTTSWLVPALTAIAWGRGSAALVSEGGYDNVLQDLSRLSPGEERPDAIALLPWNARLLGGAATVEDELTFWEHAWNLIGALGSRLLQVGYDWVVPGASGHFGAGSKDGPVGRVRELNAALRERLPQGAYFLDLEQISGTIGRNSFYDMRRYYWTKQPFSESGSCLLAEHLWAGTRALTTGPKKVVVVDLDNTLWGGVVGETGALGVALGDSPDGEAHRALQKHLKDLTARGVVLAIASKNNPADGVEPFETNPDMVLKLDDFAAVEINWEPKGTTIARIAETLNLGLDSFVFVDDNPAEREQVRQARPDVEVVELPEDPAEYVRALQRGLWFETTGVTDADRERAEQYAVERKRRDLRQSYATMDDYLASLEMIADVRAIDDADMQRVVQLLAKTNQFNLTTRRHTREDVAKLLAHPEAIGLTFRLADRFGDHGLIAAVLGAPSDEFPSKTLRLDTWLMSCRVIGRTVEQFTLAEIAARAKALGYRRVLGEFIPTKKNALVADLYESLGFRSHADEPGPSRRFILDLEEAATPRHFIKTEAGIEPKASP